MTKDSVCAVILAGGKSSRLFPFNKILSDLTGSGRSLIQQAYDRLSLLSKKQIYVLTVKDMIAPIRRQLKLPLDHIFVDPVRRGTWPALLWAMAHLRAKNPDCVMGVVTGDHVIPRVKEFQKTFRQGVAAARDRAAFVVIPVTPHGAPEKWTGFGAVRGAAKGDHGLAPALQIGGFEEKPSVDRAREMIQEGKWFWNAGMFFFRISVAEAVLKRFQPDVYAIYQRMADAVAMRKMKMAAQMFESFPDKIRHPLYPDRLVDHSVDYAVMTPLAQMSSGDFSALVTRQALTRWTDLGQWTALRDVVKLDSHNNVRIGDVRVSPSVRNSILVADRGHRIDVSDVHDVAMTLSGGKALVTRLSDLDRVKQRVLDANPQDRIIGDKVLSAGFQLRREKKVVILSNRLKEAL